MTSEPTVRDRMKLLATIVVVLLIVDQATKWWTRAETGGVEGTVFWPIWPGWFELKLVYNRGIAFGLAQGAGPYLAPIAVVISAIAAVYSYRNPKEPTLVHVTMGLLIAGAIGNLIDRVWMGKVTDLFWIRKIDFPVFNIADMCISIAAGLMLLSAVQDFFRKPPEDQSKNSNTPSASSDVSSVQSE